MRTGQQGREGPMLSKAYLFADRDWTEEAEERYEDGHAFLVHRIALTNLVFDRIRDILESSS